VDAVFADRARAHLAARYLEAVNPRLKGSPHAQLAAMIHDGEEDILEVCAGTGFLSRMVATRFPHARVCALELSAEPIAEGRRRAQGLRNLEFVNADATRMPHADGSFDLVLAAFGLSELSPTTRAECLAEIRRVLAKEGRLLVADVADIDDPGPYARLFHAYRSLSRRRRSPEVSEGGLSRQIRSSGFSVVEHVRGQGRMLPFQIIVALRDPA
jgi:demethylmenaquinone methyltransferase/2-methoxy-6-polyprenyl-1,4-benzoquinol methylase